jgi:hypothetical protein
MLAIIHFALFQAHLESIKVKTFSGEVFTWSLAFFLLVIMGFKIFDRFFSDPASILDILKHLAFLFLAAKYYFLTRSVKSP